MSDISPTATMRVPNSSNAYTRASFSAASMNKPNGLYSSDGFGSFRSNGRNPTYDRSAALSPLSPVGLDAMSFAPTPARPAPAIVIRRLPRTIRRDSLEGMLIFAGDLIDVDLIPSPYAEDQGFATAVARFHSQAGALEAQQKLNGKPNTTKDANMIVEVHSGSMSNGFEWRATIDVSAARSQASSASSGSSGTLGRSRFNSTFQNTGKVSPPIQTPSSSASGDFPLPESNTHFASLFSPSSPLFNLDDRHHISGKSMINDDSADDETGELLKDPVAYAKSGPQSYYRRSTQPAIPVTRFGSLSLGTHNGSSTVGMPPMNELASPRATVSTAGQAPLTSPAHGGANGVYNGNFPRPQYPPVNPADQNPPCNTLYVGNLPIDTSEDELKALFSKQRGYKRLCFRTKQNGPMCFVEFEDVSFATKTLNELYGAPLHNSVKGGIRLSFSKNPLGVRSGQMNGLGSNPAMVPQSMAQGYNGASGSGGAFGTMSGPPPGLSAPPGLLAGNPYRNPSASGMDGMFSNPFGVPSPDYMGNGASQTMSGGVPGHMGSATFSRDSRAPYSEFMLGR